MGDAMGAPPVNKFYAVYAHYNFRYEATVNTVLTGRRTTGWSSATQSSTAKTSEQAATTSIHRNLSNTKFTD